MDFSNDYCTKLRPKCNSCIISKYCDYKVYNNFQKIKVSKNKKYCTSYFIYDFKGYFFVRRRPIEDILGGMYEVPSSDWKTSKNINNIEKLIKLEKDYHPSSLSRAIKHEFSHFTLFSEVIFIKKEKVIINNLIGQWVNGSTIQKFPISNLTKKIIYSSFEEISSLRKFL